MKKSYSKLLILVMALVMSMSMAASVFAEGEDEVELKLTTQGMFTPKAAKLVGTGDATNLVLTYDSKSYDKLYVGTAKEAVITADPAKTVAKSEEGTYTLPIGNVDGEFIIAAHSVSHKGWYDRVFTLDKEAKTLHTATKPELIPDDYNPELVADGGVVITNEEDEEFSTIKIRASRVTAEEDGTLSVQIAAGGSRANCPRIALVEQDKTDEEKESVAITGVSTAPESGYEYLFEFSIDADQIGEKIPVSTYRKSWTSKDGVTTPDEWNKWSDQKYITVKNTPAVVNQLITQIQVQKNNEYTEKYIELAKKYWDALPDDQKEEDDGYFSDDTGDAEADDPLNQDEIGEKELLVVSFGTSFNDSRANDIGGIEKALAKAYPGWSVRRAFTAQIIINHVQARDGEKIDNMEQALDRAVANGVKELVVQPTHLMHGAEYDELKEAVDAYADKFDSVVIAEPLLGQVGDEAAAVNADKEATAKAAVAEAVKVAGFDSLDAAAEDGTAFVFMGHGTAHEAAITYDQMQAQMKALGYKNVFIGTVEGNPEDTALPAVKKAVEEAGYEHVILRPLMVVAGDHANNDMAANEEGSWYYAFVNGGEFKVEGSDEAVDIGKEFGAANVDCQIEGLGRIPAVQKLYVAHTMDAINEIEPITKINSKVLELVQNQELIDAYLKASAFVDEYKPLVDAIVKNLDNGDTSDIEAYGRQLDELIKEMYDYAADYAAELEEDPEIKAAIDEVIAKAEELNDLLKEYGIDLSDGISDEEKAIIEEKLEEAKAELDKAIADLMDALNEEVLKEALDEFIEQAKDWAKDAAKEAGLTDEEIEEFMKQIEDLAAIIDEYAGMEPSEALDKLIEDAKALIEENADELKELAQQAINDAYEAFQNGDYDEYIAKTGLDPETVKAAVDDLVAYAMGAAAGDTYTALQDKVAALTEQLEKAQADAAAAQDALDQLKKDAEAQKASAEEKDAVIKQFINGYNVTKKKPTMKKAKAAKKKKVKVTFKGLKGAEATSYQISYKTGKKTKKKTVKKATTSAKKLNYTLKKLKKGKKYTVKVRAMYQFKYNGKTYKFMSKWSKGKKVKVK